EAGPVDEIGAVRSVGAATDTTMRNAVTSGKRGAWKDRVTDRKRAIVRRVWPGLLPAREHFAAPRRHGLRKLGCNFWHVSCNVSSLTRVGHHIEERAIAIKAVLLRANANSAILMRENHPLRPVARLAEEQRGNILPVERLVTHARDA